MKKELKEKFLETYKNHVIDGMELKYSQTADRMCEFWFLEIENVLESLLDIVECPHERDKLKEQILFFNGK